MTHRIRSEGLTATGAALNRTRQTLPRPPRTTLSLRILNDYITPHFSVVCYFLKATTASPLLLSYMRYFYVMLPRAHQSLMSCTTPYMRKYSNFPRRTFWIVTILTAMSRYFIYLFIGLHTLNLLTRGNAMHSWLLMLRRLLVQNIHTDLCRLNHIFTLVQSQLSVFHFFMPLH